MNISELLQARDISKQELEVIFRTSSSPDELFDALRLAISSRVKEPEFYKTLLWNKALSTDEIVMYAEKISREFPEISYPVFYSVGQIFGSISFYGKHLDKAMSFFKKAADSKPGIADPYLAVMKMYNHELNVPGIDDILDMVQAGLEVVDKKSPFCFEISAFFKKIGNKEKERIYRKLGEKYQKEEE
jgi:hypothetical protein